MALSQKNLYRLLAYSSVSQMGYILFAFSLGFVGFAAGLFHLVNNALLKILLFVILGSIISKHGKIKPVNMPLTGACFLLASLGIAGIPPLNGFASKFLIYEAGIRAGFAIPVLVAIIVSVITLAYYLKAFSRLFTGVRRKTEEDKTFLLPVLILTGLCILLGLFPNLALEVLRPAAESLIGRAGYYCSVFGC
jgi:formate hydrogenlyase subunit 3/multisubunit Na+/H+ antiporter MnhD subunit